MAKLFSDGFETGDLTAWSSSVTDSGDLSVTTGAAIHGTYGMSVLIDGTGAIYTVDDTPNSETRYRCRFYVDPNSLTMADGNDFNIFRARKSPDVTCFTITLRYTTAGGYTISAIDRTDNGSFSKFTSNYPITDTLHCIELDWQASSAPGANNGQFTLWIDGVLKETVSGIDNDTEVIDSVLFGAVQNIDAGTSGTFYLDDFSSNNDGNTIGKIFTASGFDKMRCWEYSSNYLGGSSSNTWFVQSSQIPYDMADIAAAGFNVVKIYADENNASSQLAALDQVQAAGLKAIVLRFITYNTDYSVATGGANRTAAIAKFTGMISNLKGHPAVIGWGFGNENNYNLGTTSKTDWYTLLEAAIVAGKAIDATRFYWTANGELADIRDYGDLLAPSIDLWAANIYRGTTMSGITDDIQNATSKPFFLSEFGRTRSSNGQSDQDTQAAEDVALIREVESYYPVIRGWSHFKFTDTVTPGTVYGVTAPLAQGTYQSRTKYAAYDSIKTYVTRSIYGGVSITALGLGINFAHDFACYSNNAECIRQLTILKDLGINRIRVNIPTYQVQDFNASFRDQLRLVCTTAKAMGFYVIWGYNAFPLTSSNRAAFKQACRDGAAWAESEGIDEWCTGNEEDLQASDTSGGSSDLNKDAIIATIMDINYTIKITDGLTIRLSSATTTEGYDKWAALVDTWFTYMTLDFHVYGIYNISFFYDKILAAVTALGDNVYCGEFGNDNGRLAFTSDSDWIKETLRRRNYIIAVGMSSYYAFAYSIQGDINEENRWSWYRQTPKKPTELLRFAVSKRQNVFSY